MNQHYRSRIKVGLDDAALGDLPQPGYWALMALGRGVRDASALTREMGITKQAVSKLVDTLVSSGYVEREPDRIDRRRTALAMTPKGRWAVGVITAAVDETEQTFIATLGATSFAQLTHMLEQLVDKEH